MGHASGFSTPPLVRIGPSGDRELFEAVTRIRPRLHIFGHTHGANGIFTTDDTMFLNAALFGAHRDLDAKPIVLQIARK